MSVIPTPALVVDVPALERNLARATDYFAGRSTRLRPHFKAHKCTTLLRRQVAHGACAGVTCATAWEAEVVARAGVHDDILLANEVAGAPALASLARAAERARVTVCVDHPAHVALLSGLETDVLVELDVGQGRCGLDPGDAEGLLALVRAVDAAPGLRFRGLQGYEGHAVLVTDRAARGEQVARAAAGLKAARARLEAAGFACEVISGGGTGTYDLSTEAGALNEIQAGSYALMDATYERLGLPYEVALTCRATIVSRHGRRAVADAGLKALSAEYGLPRALDPGVEVVGLADEHATLRVRAGSALAVGDVVELVPAHVDPTVNLHAALHAVTADGTVEVWPVDARRP